MTMRHQGIQSSDTRERPREGGGPEALWVLAFPVLLGKPSVLQDPRMATGLSMKQD
jgi:hypothetical protein